MMKETTKKQVISLFKKVQKFQVLNGGKNRISTSFAYTDNGLWFNAWGFLPNDEDPINLSVYQFFDFETNVRRVEEFFKSFE